jgi:hypothetical protein
MLDSPPLPPPAPDRFWPSSQKILAYANRAVRMPDRPAAPAAQTD